MKKKKQIAVIGGTYPADFTFWQTDPEKLTPIVIANQGDFNVNRVFDSLGISQSWKESFGICNLDEINLRNELLYFFAKNPELADYFRKLELRTLFPADEQEFVNFFHPKLEHNPFWQKVYDIHSMLLATEQLPERLKLWHESILANLPLEAMEREVGNYVSDEITKSALIEGYVSFAIILNSNQTGDQCVIEKIAEVESRVFGHSMYSRSLGNIYNEVVPDWVENKWNPLCWLGIGKIVSWYVNQINIKRRRDAMKSMTITSLPKVLSDDISSSLRVNFFTQPLLKKIKASRDSSVFRELKVFVYFVYDKEGLKLKVVDVESNSEIDSNFSFSQRDLRNLERESDFYSKPDRVKAEKLLNDINEQIDDRIKNIRSAIIRKCIADHREDFFNRLVKVKSTQADKQYKWSMVNNFYHNNYCASAINELNAFRTYLSGQLGQLQRVISLADILIKKADQLKTTVCRPEVISGAHQPVAFQSIYPLSLISSLPGDKIVPIKNLPSINGTMLGLTGRHGGGKSVAGISILENVYLAQSGLLVFGSDFKTNVKRLLGAVLNDEGVGSTATIYLSKVKILLENMKKFKNHESLIFIDEIGKGTQECHGLQLGRDLLTKLAKDGNSLIFNTQILDLAVFAKEELGATCFFVNKNHEFSPGIADGGMDQLRKELGINALLS